MRKVIKITGLLLVVASFGLAATPPAKKKKSVKWLQDLSSRADSSSSRPATVAGVRGLEEVGAAPDLAARDYPAIDRLDKIQIKDDELQKFIGEGKLQ